MPYRTLAPLLGILLANALAATLIMAIVPLVAVEQFGATVAQALLLETAYYSTKLLTAPLLGHLSDRYGRRPLMLLSQAGTSAGFLCFLSAFFVQGEMTLFGLGHPIHQGLFLLYLGKLLDGVTAGNSTVARAYVADLVPRARYSQVMGWLAATLGVAFILGPALSGLFIAYQSLTAPFAIAAVLTLLAWGAAFILLPESLPRAARQGRGGAIRPVRNLHQLRQQTAFLRLALTGAGATLSFGALFAAATLYIRAQFFPAGSDPATIGAFVSYLLTAMGLILALSQLLLNHWLVSRWGEFRVMRLSQLLMVAGFVLVPLLTDRYLFALLMLPLTAAHGLLEPNVQAQIAQLDQSGQGQRLGLFQALNSLADLLGPIWVALLFARFEPAAIWWLAALIMGSTLLLYWGKWDKQPSTQLLAELATSAAQNDNPHHAR
ncbi:MAG: MFS transporter [Anaerolineales bacterium]|nr:MFS transporter [Anaerolineales bacterium]